MIVSASRRTDIPAFFSDWFLDKIRKGYVLSQNPYNPRQIKKVSLDPGTTGIVFWTKNAAPMMPFLKELTTRGFFYYFQYTITGYPKWMEPNCPALEKSIQTFQSLSRTIGAEKVIWRFDPIFLCEQISPSSIIQNFQKIADSLNGYTRRVMISFFRPYKKTLNRIRNLQYYDIFQQPELLDFLLSKLSHIAGQNRIEIQTCSGDTDFKNYGIIHGKCIDNDLLMLPQRSGKDPYQRPLCNCIRSIDIGMYDSCPHDCLYCYANRNPDLIRQNGRKHNAEHDLLIGNTNSFFEENGQIGLFS